MLRSTALAASLLSAAIAHGQTYEVRTPHFTVVTDAGESTGEAIARRLESIERLFEDAFSGDAVDHRDRVVVLAVSDETAMARLLPEIWEDAGARKPDGVYRESIDKDYIVVRLDARSEGPYSTLYHEAFHVFARNRFGPLPLWLDEGLAKFWEMTSFDADRVRVGGPSNRNLKVLAEEVPLPLSVLFTVDHASSYYLDHDRSEHFYAQSWALVHYLLLGDDSGERRRQMLSFLQASRSQRQASVHHPFGELDDLARSVREYTEGRRFMAIERALPATLAANELQTRLLSDAEALAVRGNFLVRGDTPQRARAVLERAYALEPDLPLVHEGFGFLALEEGDTQAALDAFARAGELDPSSFLAHYYHAVALFQAGASIDVVLARLERSLSANPDFAPAHLSLATTVAELGEDDERGLASANELVELTPMDPEAHWVRGRLLVAAGDEAAGVTSYRKALALPSQDGRIYRALAVDLLELDLADEASVALGHAHALAPEDPETAFTLALTLAQAGRVDEAIQAFETAIALAPDVVHYHERLAELLIESGRDAEAVAHLRAALEQSPLRASLHYQLSTALAAVGKVEEAAHHLRLSQDLGFKP